MARRKKNTPEPQEGLLLESENTPQQEPEQAPAITLDEVRKVVNANNTKVLTAVCEVMNNATPKLLEGFAPLIKDSLLEELQGQIVEAIANAPYSKPVIEIKTPEKATEIDGITHEKLQDVIQALYLDIPVYLYGPAGTGKSELVQQAAKALGLDFYGDSCIHQDYTLTGFIDANGHYHETEFYRAFKNGGLFFLDEMDASIPEALTILNSALANKYFPFPCGRVTAHKDFRVIAAGNTIGRGADSEYTGRQQLDAATLNRFAIKIFIDYSEKIEKAVTNNNGELLEFCHQCRANAQKAGYNFIFSYRDLKAISLLESTGQDLKTILHSTIFAGMHIDDIYTITNTIEDNKYCNAV